MGRHFFPQHSESVTLTSARFYANVVLSGGTTICQRIVEHMTKKSTALAPSTLVLRGGVVSDKSHWSQKKKPKDSSIFPDHHQGDVDIRKVLFANVVSSSGTAMFHGTGERREKELTALASFTMKFMVGSAEWN